MAIDNNALDALARNNWMISELHEAGTIDLNKRKEFASEHAVMHKALSTQSVDVEKIAPVQGFSTGIPWDMHLRAYDAYCDKYSKQQALIEGGCRGGFGVGELDDFIPNWREELEERRQKALQPDVRVHDIAVLPCVSCGESSNTSTPDDADMCWQCFGEFNAGCYDELIKKIEAVDDLRVELKPEWNDGNHDEILKTAITWNDCLDKVKALMNTEGLQQ